MSGQPLWICKGSPDKGHIEDIPVYGDHCIACGATNPNPSGSPINPNNSNSSASSINPLMIGGLALMATAGVAYGAYRFLTLPPKPTPTPTVSPSPIPSVTTKCPLFKPSQMPERFSLGDKALLPRDPIKDLNSGIEEFALNNYDEAVTFFKNAVESARIDPEPKIYLNNALARQQAEKNGQPCPLTIAVVVPIQGGNKSKPESAREILRGVADVQTQFNESGGINNRLLEILIVNDGNDPDIAPQVAQEISQESQILAVIGHNSSSASKAAFAGYDQQGVAMISPTSTATLFQELNEKSDNQVFFRPVPSDKFTAPFLAKYAQNELSSSNAVIFYDSSSPYSKSLLAALEEALTQQNINIVSKIDIDPPNFDSQQTIEESLELGADTAILLPSTDSVSRAIRIAKANNGRMKLLGADALYSANTLINGGLAVSNLTLVVPIAPDESYTKEAQEQWGGTINWRTVAGFDATQAVVETFKQAEDTQLIDRQYVLTTLKSMTPDVQSKVSESKAPISKASGKPLEFNQGEREIRPCIVQADKKAPIPHGYGFGFKKIKCGS